MKPNLGSTEMMNQAGKENQRDREISKQLLHLNYEDLGQKEKKVVRHLTTKTHIASN
jgi:hypothetical protein